MSTFILPGAVGTGAAVVFVVLTTIITYLFGITNSVTARIFLDGLLTNVNRNWLTPFLIVLLMLAAIQLIASWIRAVYAYKINGKLAAVGSVSFFWKVLHLPMEFFSQRLAGDIHLRQDQNAYIAGTLVGTFGPLLMNTTVMALYLFIMLSQSLLFDEATSALDNKTQMHISKALDTMGCTRIVIAHRLSTIKNCSRILVLDDGRIIEQGTYGELMERSGFFADLVARQELNAQEKL